MKFTALRPMIWTEQLQQSIDFYTIILGFTLDEKNDEWCWASLHRDDVSLMMAKPNSSMRFEKPVFTGSFYINTDDVEAIWKDLREKVAVVYPIETFPWEMREFAIYDNNGYIIQFGQEVELE